MKFVMKCGVILSALLLSPLVIGTIIYWDMVSTLGFSEAFLRVLGEAAVQMGMPRNLYSVIIITLSYVTIMVVVPALTLLIVPAFVATMKDETPWRGMKTLPVMAFEVGGSIGVVCFLVFIWMHALS